MGRDLPAITILVAVAVCSSSAQALDFSVQKFTIGGEGGHDYIVAEPGTGRVFVFRQDHMMVVDGPTGIAYDAATNRIFSGCSNVSVVTDADSGKVVATISNGDGVDALGTACTTGVWSDYLR